MVSDPPGQSCVPFASGERAMSSKARGWRNCGCYLHRTRKPSAFLGLPFIGRHNAYVGETSSRYFRDRQHKSGDFARGKAAAAWSDLDPKTYPLPCLFPHWKWSRKIQEKLWIFLLMPVYNEQWNKHNPRRISRHKAQNQRWARDKTGVKVNLGRVAVRYSIGWTLVVLLMWGGYQYVVSR